MVSESESDPRWARFHRDDVTAASLQNANELRAADDLLLLPGGGESPGTSQRTNSAATFFFKK